jgi:hypothetical protein
VVVVHELFRHSEIIPLWPNVLIIGQLIYMLFKACLVYLLLQATNYARSAMLYVQTMLDLPDSHPDIFKQFMDGNHTVRHSDRFWSGLSLDLLTEQTLMWAVKSRGGLTRGRGMHASL